VADLAGAAGRETPLGKENALPGRPVVLEHTTCPRCHAPNLAVEFVCFACGAALRPFRKGVRAGPIAVPWPLWVALVLGLLVTALVFWRAAEWLAGYRERAAIPLWYLPAAGIGLVAAGQLALYQARTTDRRWWRLKRAPELELAQADPGDVAWVRGKLRCDTPLFAPYVNQACAYYRLVVREREEGQAGWKTVRREANAVDFAVVQDMDSIYVPSGGVLFDAGLYVDSVTDPGGTQQVRVWALPVGLPVSVCGKLEGEATRLRMDALGQGLPAVATWRSPASYVSLVGRRAKIAQVAGWLISVAGTLVLIAGVARA